MLHELIDLYLQGAPGCIAQIQQFANNPQKLAFHAHALKSMSLNLGCKKVIELSQKLEQLGNAGEVRAAEITRELETAFNETKKQLLVLRDRENKKT